MRHYVLTLMTVLALVASPAGLTAEGYTSKGVAKSGLPKAQLKLLEGRLSTQYEDSKRLIPTDKHLPRYTGDYSGKFRVMAEEAAALFGVPKDLFTRLVEQESRWNEKVISPSGAIGLTQLMPATARHLGVDPYDPKANLEGGALYLKQQYMRFRSWKLAVAAYNAGPEAVDAYNDVPPYPETVAYVQAILGH